tara:strand:+ start:236 stop:499 length:264 start_codon:yes stop_codon:yes gene_type:complete
MNNTHTTKQEVLERLNELKKDVLDYADYNHFTEYDYNVELTLKKLDEVYESLSTKNVKYGLNHTINNIVRNNDIDISSDEWVDEDED